MIKPTDDDFDNGNEMSPSATKKAAAAEVDPASYESSIDDDEDDASGGKLIFKAIFEQEAPLSEEELLQRMHRFTETELSELDQYKWFYYLLLRWATLTVSIIEPSTDSKFPPTIISPEADGLPPNVRLPIYDYGDQLVVSRTEEWAEGFVTFGRMINSVEKIVGILQARGVKQVAIFGVEQIRCIAWVHLSETKTIEVVNFEATIENLKMRERIAKMRKEAAINALLRKPMPQ